MSLKAKIEAIIYAADTPVTLDQIVKLVKDRLARRACEFRSQVRATLEELVAEYGAEGHGIEVRQVAGGYRMSTKPEHHDVVRAFAKSLKPPIRLSLPALETLAVIAYKQPVTVPRSAKFAVSILAASLAHFWIASSSRPLDARPSSAGPFFTRPPKNFSCALD